MKLISENEFFNKKDLFIDSNNSYKNSVDDNYFSWNNSYYDNYTDDKYDSYSNTLSSDFYSYYDSFKDEDLSVDDFSFYDDSHIDDLIFNTFDSNITDKHSFYKSALTTSNLDNFKNECPVCNCVNYYKDSCNNNCECNCNNHCDCNYKNNCECTSQNDCKNNCDDACNNDYNCKNSCECNIKKDFKKNCNDTSNTDSNCSCKSISKDNCNDKKKEPCKHLDKKNNIILNCKRCATTPLPIISNNILGTVTPIEVLSLTLKNSRLDNLKTLISFNCLITSVINISLNLSFVLRKFNDDGYSVVIGSFNYSDTLEFLGTTSFSFQAFDINNDSALFDNIYYAVEVIPLAPIISLGASIDNCSLSSLGVNNI